MPSCEMMKLPFTISLLSSSFVSFAVDFFGFPYSHLLFFIILPSIHCFVIAPLFISFLIIFFNSWKFPWVSSSYWKCSSPNPTPCTTLCIESRHFQYGQAVDDLPRGGIRFEFVSFFFSSRHARDSRTVQLIDMIGYLKQCIFYLARRHTTEQAVIEWSHKPSISI